MTKERLEAPRGLKTLCQRSKAEDDSDDDDGLLVTKELSLKSRGEACVRRVMTATRITS